MWMAIQRGEGPTAPVLDGGPVFVGDTLSIVFTLTDRIFWFDSNILSCYAFDGEPKEQRNFSAIGFQINNLGDVPKRVGHVPKRVGHVPKRVGDVLKRVGDVLKRMGDVPKK